MQEIEKITIPRATGLLVIEVCNSNPNGDPDQENDPRRRSHDHRGMITGVSFKRKIRDLVLRKDQIVWKTIARNYNISENNGTYSLHGYYYDILEDRDLKGSEVTKLIREGETNSNFDAFQKRYWDGRVFGNTFLPEETNGNHIRSGVAHFGLAVSVSPVKVHRLTKTKMAPPGGRSENDEGPTRGMAPLAHRVVEHGVYTMPFFINPTGSQGKRGNGCTALDLALLLNLIRYAYPHTKSDIRPLVEIRHGWYAEHKDNLGSFSEFEFIEKLTPKRKGADRDTPSVSGIPLNEQYELPSSDMNGFKAKLKKQKLYDLCVELPDWCANIKSESTNE
ncbi:type I CRISPR-associated protein Cas7 [uncultured Desulfosarcina sp.]|uniref:type I CRISPR-associated protein Cas7 n=1 Tax=uncultured Desulfosarcina sp. TaxID=218289 RepID=UPI0029C82A82|nr:type I CRISPR-associated protein Cas7 [uncultured Desulfosarcina sp.]